MHLALAVPIVRNRPFESSAKNGMPIQARDGRRVPSLEMPNPPSPEGNESAVRDQPNRGRHKPVKAARTGGLPAMECKTGQVGEHARKLGAVLRQRPVSRGIREPSTSTASIRLPAR